MAIRSVEVHIGVTVLSGVIVGVMVGQRMFSDLNSVLDLVKLFSV